LLDVQVSGGSGISGAGTAQSDSSADNSQKSAANMTAFLSSMEVEARVDDSRARASH
jgi:hypothetical protein